MKQGQKVRAKQHKKARLSYRVGSVVCRDWDVPLMSHSAYLPGTPGNQNFRKSITPYA